ncbi:unnamed protein product [Protopolystoma xenopodis]|uniref:Uncharacterized protein n=1 Tax=Protopolystoma xenopodis TaxID=117903 RepID=A0A3S5CIB6_9PLAT|nr:unnamed protein product [Protopolystoma xenopodis]
MTGMLIKFGKGKVVELLPDRTTAILRFPCRNLMMHPTLITCTAFSRIVARKTSLPFLLSLELSSVEG